MNKLPQSVWKKIRLEYQSTKTTCRALAEKYGLNSETVSNRCKVEKWRFGRQEHKKTRSRSTNQLVEVSAPPDPVRIAQRVLHEADLWLDRIQEAYEKEVRYDRIEAIQKLLPQWKNAVEQIQKRGDQLPAKQPNLQIDVAMLSFGKVPPLLVSPEEALEMERQRREYGRETYLPSRAIEAQEVAP
jgi:hypothetical protein